MDEHVYHHQETTVDIETEQHSRGDNVKITVRNAKSPAEAAALYFEAFHQMHLGLARVNAEKEYREEMEKRLNTNPPKPAT